MSRRYCHKDFSHLASKWGHLVVVSCKISVLVPTPNCAHDTATRSSLPTWVVGDLHSFINILIWLYPWSSYR